LTKFKYALPIVMMVVAACGSQNSNSNGKNDPASAAAAAAANCGQQLGGQLAFCETFDSPHPTAGRSGQLDNVLWGVSRSTGNNNISGLLDDWKPSQIDACGTLQASQPDGTDVLVCNGQVREATNDDHTVTTLALYPRQPFDFAGRTGTVSFDVSNDSFGSHDTWPEFWITDQPVPAPQAHNMPCDTCSLPRNSIGIRFMAALPPGQGPQVANCPADSNWRWTVDSIVATSNYGQAEFPVGNAHALGCVKSATGPNGALNHVEVRISSTQIDVYATDPGSTTLVHLSSTQLTVPLTRGLVWIEDAHYNAAKSGQPMLANGDGQHTTHTYAWDNVAFDGPVLPRDISVDVPDAVQPASDGNLNLGWKALPTAPATLTTLPVTAAQVAAAPGALLMFNYSYDIVKTFTYTVNGQSFSAAAPSNTWSMNKSIALPVPASALVAGAQQVSIAADVGIIVSNVNVVIPGVGGTVAPGGGTGGGTPPAPPAPPALPAAPTGVTGAPQSMINLSWAAVSGATGYNVYRGTSQTGPFTVVGSNVAQTSYSDKTVAVGTSYWYTISTISSAGEGAQSAPIAQAVK
jgi:hypothetical protein